MRPVLLSLALALCVGGCAQHPIPPPARILGTNSLAVVNDLMFVTSTGGSELRALDLSVSPRDFVRAPNPLEPLSIPVLGSPTALARDLDYDSTGAEAVGPYVYVQGAAAAEISIVGARRDTQLIELKRVSAPGIVTAIAARAPASEGQSDCRQDRRPCSTLYFATLSAGQGSLWQLFIPPPDGSGKMSADPPPPTLLRYALGSSLSGDPISSLVILPNGKIGVASRAAGTTTGRTIIFDVQTGQQWPLDFSTPVRQLVTHPAIEGVFGAGARVFGVLDEDACGTNPDCPGILAVDACRAFDGTDPDCPGAVAADMRSARFGLRPIDKSGFPMLPIRFGLGGSNALTTGLTLALRVPLIFPTGVADPPIKLLGVVSTSNGIIYFFDPIELNVYDVNPAFAKVGTLLYSAPDGTALASYVDSSGTLVAADESSSSRYVAGPVPASIAVAHGATRDETVTITYQGTIPGFRNLTVDEIRSVTIDTIYWRLPVPGADLSRLSVNKDRIVLSGDGCVSEVGLSKIDPTASNQALLTSESVGCTASVTFSVRAGGNEPDDIPYVVEGTATGYMGRTGNGRPGNDRPFVFPKDVGDRYRRYYYHSPDPLAPFDPTVPQIQFSMGSGDSSIQRDARYAMLTVSNFSPEFIVADIGIIGIDFHMPGASAYVGALSNGTDVSRLYVAYPAANAILEFSPTLLAPNGANSRYVVAYR